MTKEKIIAKTQELVGDLFEVRDIMYVNHKPHMYMIGPGHIRNNILDDAKIRRLERDGHAHCYQRGCTASYDQHTSEQVIALGMVRTLTNKEAADALYKVRIQVCEPQNIAGFVFVRGDEKFIIEPPIKEGGSDADV